MIIIQSRRCKIWWSAKVLFLHWFYHLDFPIFKILFKTLDLIMPVCARPVSFSHCSLWDHDFNVHIKSLWQQRQKLVWCKSHNTLAKKNVLFTFYPEQYPVVNKWLPPQSTMPLRLDAPSVYSNQYNCFDMITLQIAQTSMLQMVCLFLQILHKPSHTLFLKSQFRPFLISMYALIATR